MSGYLQAAMIATPLVLGGAGNAMNNDNYKANAAPPLAALPPPPPAQKNPPKKSNNSQQLFAIVSALSSCALLFSLFLGVVVAMSYS